MRGGSDGFEVDEEEEEVESVEEVEAEEEEEEVENVEEVEAEEEEEEVENVEEVEAEEEEEEVENVEEVEVEEEVEVIEDEEIEVEEEEEGGDEEDVDDKEIKESPDEREELMDEDQRAVEEFIEQKDDVEDGKGETEKEHPQAVVNDQPNQSPQTQISTKEEEAKELDGHKSPVLKGTDHLGDRAKPAFDATSILEVDGRESPALGKMDHLGSLVRSAFDVDSIADHGKHPVSMQTEYSGNHVRSVLESVSVAGLLDIKSPIARKTDISENHARSNLVRSRSPSADVTLDTSNKRPSMICDFYAKGWCIKGSSCRFFHQKDHSQNAKSGRPLGRECLDGPDVSSSNLLHRALIRAYGEERPQMSHIAQENSSAISGKRERIIRNEANVDLLNEVPVHTTVSGFSSSPAQLYCSTSSSTGMRKFDPSYNSCDWDLSARKLPNHFESANSYSSDVTSGHQSNASLTRGALPSDYLAANHKSVISGDKKQTVASVWEPSVPFRSSICPVAPPLLSASDQYDPLIDSIEPAKGSIDVPGLGNHDSVPRENTSPGYTDFKLGGAFRISHETRADIVQGKGHGVSIGTESGFDITDCGLKSSMFEGLKNSSVYASDLSNIKKDLTERNLKAQEDRSSHYKESKVMKVFRGAVADFVKDLLKPSWLSGHLSKDTHKLIVKKAVEKVCGALQPHQIPSGNESTNQYFFSNRPKLVKLVEGYVEKYAKS